MLLKLRRKAQIKFTFFEICKIYKKISFFRLIFYVVCSKVKLCKQYYVTLWLLHKFVKRFKWKKVFYNANEEKDSGDIYQIKSAPVDSVVIVRCVDVQYGQFDASCAGDRRWKKKKTPCVNTIPNTQRSAAMRRLWKDSPVRTSMMISVATWGRVPQR